MSKFIEKLKRSTQITPAPMGFGRAAAQAKPMLMLVACVAGADIKKIPEYIAGADAGMLTIDNLNSGLEAFQKLSGAAGGIPWGGSIKDDSWGKKEAPVISADFIVFPLEMSLFSITTDLGKVVEIDTSMSDSMLRAIEELPLDAVLVSLPDKLSWQSVAVVQRIDSILSKFLLVKIQCDINTAEMESLWKAGADALVVEIDSGQINRIKELREAIDKANFPLPRKSKKVNVILPLISSGAPAKEEEEEEEEEE